MRFRFAFVAALAIAAAAGLAAQTAAPGVVAVFEGTLPCGDCSGLRTQLTLSAADTDAAAEGTFVAKYTYVGAPKGDTTRQDTGTWKLVRGTPSDKNAVVYDLVVKGTKNHEYWLQVNTDELQQLDRNRRPIDAPMPLRLRRANALLAPPPGAYRPMDKGDMAVDMAVMFAMRDESEKIPNLSIVEIKAAERQIVAGTNYRLCLAVKRGANAETARAVVFQDLKGAMRLASWTWEDCK